MKNIGYVEVSADMAMNHGAAIVAYVDAVREQMRIQAEAEALAELESEWLCRGWWHRKDPMPTLADAEKRAIKNTGWRSQCKLPKPDHRRFQENLRQIGEELMELCFAAAGQTPTIWINNEAAAAFRSGDWYSSQANQISKLNARFSL